MTTAKELLDQTKTELDDIFNTLGRAEPMDWQIVVDGSKREVVRLLLSALREAQESVLHAPTKPGEEYADVWSRIDSNLTKFWEGVE